MLRSAAAVCLCCEETCYTPCPCSLLRSPLPARTMRAPPTHRTRASTPLSCWSRRCWRPRTRTRATRAGLRECGRSWGRGAVWLMAHGMGRCMCGHGGGMLAPVHMAPFGTLHAATAPRTFLPRTPLPLTLPSTTPCTTPLTRPPTHPPARPFTLYLPARPPPHAPPQLRRRHERAPGGGARHEHGGGRSILVRHQRGAAQREAACVQLCAAAGLHGVQHAARAAGEAGRAGVVLGRGHVQRAGPVRAAVHGVQRSRLFVLSMPSLVFGSVGCASGCGRNHQASVAGTHVHRANLMLANTTRRSAPRPTCCPRSRPRRRPTWTRQRRWRRWGDACVCCPFDCCIGVVGAGTSGLARCTGGADGACSCPQGGRLLACAACLQYWHK